MKAIVRDMDARWRRFWFEPVAPTNLGVARLLFFGLLAAFYLPHHFGVWGTVSPVFFEPIWLFDRFGVPVFAPSILTFMEVTWKLSLILTCIGWWTRTSCTVAAVLGTYLLGLPHNFGQTYHFDALLVLAFWILSFSRAGDAWSVDSLINAAKGRAPAAPSGEYLWPTQLILTGMAFVFFAAGAAKIWASGLEWVMSDHMSLLLRRVQYHISDADPLVNWGVYIADYPWAPRLLAAATLFFETCYPVALFSRRLRVPMVLGGMGLLIGIRMLMGPTFEHFLVANVFWVPWDRVALWFNAWMPGHTKMSVLYDGGCGLCRPTIAVLRRLDLRSEVEFLDVNRDWAAIHHRYPALSQEACLQEMQGIDRTGRSFAGFDTYRALAGILPLGWPAVPFLYLPPIAAIGRRVYRAIAARRDTTSCALPLVHRTPPAASEANHEAAGVPNGG